MASRYSGNITRNTNTSNGESLKEVIESRGFSSITHYRINNLKYPSVEQIENLTIIKHVWKSNDRYWKLSERYYGDPKYWWIIAWFNKKPIEATLTLGEYVSIPQPLSDVLGMI